VTEIIKPMVDSMKPQGKAGRPAKVKHCPYCHAALNVTQMKLHRPQCARDHRNVPPQAPVLPAAPPKVPMPPTPSDLENQELSRNPLERERQLDQQEQDRIERTDSE